MSEHHTYSSFTATDIERYHTGKMTSIERHAIEKAALEDPFLADAIEGYVYTSTPAADLEKIRKRLAGEEEEKARVIPFFRSNKFMRAAAVILVLAGAGFLITRFAFQPQQDIALTDTRPTVETSPKVVDSSSLVAAPTITIKEKEEEILMDQANSKPSTYSRQPQVQMNENRTEIAERNLPPVVAMEQRNDDRKDDRNAASAKLSRNMVAAKEAAPVMEAQVSKDSISGLLQRGYTNARVVRGDSITNVTIVLQESPNNYTEEVVLNRNTNRIVPRPNIIIEEPEPLLGWDHYNSYVIDNFKDPRELKTKPAEGEVELSFDVNSMGEPINIKVEKSLCSTCDAEAIRLLKDGPKWKKSQKKNVRVSILF